MTRSRDGDADADREAAGIDIAGLFERVEQQLLGGPRKYTRAEVAAESEMPTQAANKLWRSLGFATVGDEDVVFTDSDVEALKRVQYFVETTDIDEEMLSAMTRMLGRTFARLASWQGQFLIEVISQRPELATDEDSIAEFIERMLPMLEETQNFVWRRQLVAYLSRVTSHAIADVAAPGAEPTAVGFADMSNFTTLTRRASEAELRELLEAFEATATEVVGRHNGRIVKTIGDEVLFVADTPVEGAEIALDLIAAGAADPRLPPLRIGLAAGPVMSRLGDVYGSTVNIASRLTSLSRPGWVLVDRIMSEELRDNPNYSLKPRRAEAVRGFHHLRQWRLRRAHDEGARGGNGHRS